MEEATLATLEGLGEAIKYEKKSPILPQSEQGTLVVLGSHLGIGDRGEGSRGREGGDGSTDSKSNASDSEGEEEYKEDEEMVDPNLKWMT